MCPWACLAHLEEAPHKWRLQRLPASVNRRSSRTEARQDSCGGCGKSETANCWNASQKKMRWSALKVCCLSSVLSVSQLSLSLTKVEVKKWCCDLLSLNLGHRNCGACATFTWCEWENMLACKSHLVFLLNFGSMTDLLVFVFCLSFLIQYRRQMN